MATINALDVADSAILISGYNITDGSLVPFPTDWDLSQNPSVWDGGTIDTTFDVGKHSYRVTFSYDEEVGFETDDEALYLLGTGLSDEADTNGTVTSFSAYSSAGFMHFVTNTPVSESDLLEHILGDSAITPSVLSGNDLIVIQGFGSTVLAQAGNDTVLGGDGVDQIWGDDGNDLIASGAGDDVIVAGQGKDTVTAAGGNDSIWTEAGKDRIAAGSGDDLLVAGRGNDKLSGQGGDDTLYGQAGRDVLIGGKHDDDLTGGAGADKFVFVGRAGYDHITDFSDEDTLVFKNIGPADGSTLFVHAQGEDTLIDYGKGLVLLLNFSAEDLQLDDNLFVL